MSAVTEQSNPAPAASPAVPARVTRWDSDGACRCPALRNPWGGRTTHYRSQCETDPNGGPNDDGHPDHTR